MKIKTKLILSFSFICSLAPNQENHSYLLSRPFMVGIADYLGPSEVRKLASASRAIADKGKLFKKITDLASVRFKKEIIEDMPNLPTHININTIIRFSLFDGAEIVLKTYCSNSNITSARGLREFTEFCGILGVQETFAQAQETLTEETLHAKVSLSKITNFLRYISKIQKSFSGYTMFLILSGPSQSCTVTTIDHFKPILNFSPYGLLNELKYLTLKIQNLLHSKNFYRDIEQFRGKLIFQRKAEQREFKNLFKQITQAKFSVRTICEGVGPLFM